MMYFFLLSCFLASFGAGSCWRPILAFPGWNDATLQWDLICAQIKLKRPGSVCDKIQPLTVLSSELPMWEQVEIYRKVVQPYFTKYPGGVDFISHSQGTLISRALIESTPNHTVVNYMSLAGPQMGMWAVPETNLSVLGFANPQKLLGPVLSDLFYCDQGQNTISLAGYWHDPTRESDFLNKSSFLPCINSLKDHPDKEAYKASFMRLKKAFFFAAGCDTAVNPWQTEIFEYPDANGNIIPFKNSYMYLNDPIGLAAMFDRGDVVFKVIPNIDHNEFVLNFTYIDLYYLPNLK